MKKFACASAFFLVGFVTSGVKADDSVSVISVTPRYVTVYQRVCEVSDQVEPNGAGALIGGVVGGIAGHQIGRGRGNTAATIAGAMIGQNVGRNAGAGIHRQRCWEEPYQEQRGEIVGFNYNGKVFYHTFEE